MPRLSTWAWDLLSAGKRQAGFVFWPPCPFAAAGFFQYNKLTLEQFLWAFIKSKFLFAGRGALSPKVSITGRWAERGVATLSKTLAAANRSEQDSFFIPEAYSGPSPSSGSHKDGIFQVGRKYSRTWRFSDINYASASDEDQGSIFRAYSAVLNALPTDATTKITIVNRSLDQADFAKTILMEEQGDRLDRYRWEYNRLLAGKAAESNNLIQEKYITISIPERKIEEARSWFRRVDGALSKSFGKLDSTARAVSCMDRLRLFHDFFRPGEEGRFSFDPAQAMRFGVDFRDAICPGGFAFHDDYFEMGDKVGRVLFLRDFGAYGLDDMVAELSAIPRSLMLSIDILPVPTAEAARTSRASFWVWRQTSPGGGSARTHAAILLPPSPTTWNSRERRPRSF